MHTHGPGQPYSYHYLLPTPKLACEYECPIVNRDSADFSSIRVVSTILDFQGAAPTILDIQFPRGSTHYLGIGAVLTLLKQGQHPLFWNRGNVDSS